MCAGCYEYPDESEWKLGRVQIMLQTPLVLVPLENTDNLYYIFILNVVNVLMCQGM